MEFNTLVDTQVVADHLRDPTWVVVDCRFSLADPLAGRGMYIASHIRGARFADLHEDLSSPVKERSGRHPLPDTKQFINCIGGWGIDNSTQVVAYDDMGGAFASRLWWLLRWVGHRSVAVLNGGYAAWLENRFETTSDLPEIVRRDFVGQPDNEMWLSSARLVVSLDSSRTVLIDARDAERFRGEREPIDRVAGHVPGAHNLPFRGNLDGNGYFRQPEVLRDRFTHLLAGQSPTRVVHMCGSGVTACHNVLAMEIAGLPGSLLYAGSWSEWIQDPDRGIATDYR